MTHFITEEFSNGVAGDEDKLIVGDWFSFRVPSRIAHAPTFPESWDRLS
jgi:hypothetical protein